MAEIKGAVKSAVSPGWLPFYHRFLAWFSAFRYGYPSRHIFVIGVTGTKGKSSTTEMINAILEESGYKTALINSIRIKTADISVPNTMRMSMPGRGYMQYFLHTAILQGCNVAVIEMTSEGAAQFRHRFIEMDALVFTNLAPEHIESHGSLQAYADAKYEIGLQLARSSKRPRFVVANADDPEGTRYLTLQVEYAFPFTLSACQPYQSDENGARFHFEGTDIAIMQPGEFSILNALAAATLTRALGIKMQPIVDGLQKLKFIPGRAERIEAGQDFAVVVDYAHTPDSLKALYEAYKGRRKICVLGATGGGRDMWKRPVMGSIAEQYCDHVILTNEDPYDEDPASIIEAVARGMTKPPEAFVDRREAIRAAIALANPGDAVLITGKGTDPTIAGPKGSKTPWSDAQVAREEVEARMKTKTV